MLASEGNAGIVDIEIVRRLIRDEMTLTTKASWNFETGGSG